MNKVRFWMVPAIALMLAATQASVASAQQRGGRGMGRGGSIIGLLGVEAVQKELKLNDEQIEKIEAAGTKVREAMTEKYSGLRDIEDRAKRTAKMEELSKETDRMAFGELRGVLEREQFMRVLQIRLQIRGAVYGLSNEYVARRLELTDDQKAKIADIKKAAAEATTKAFSGLRDASQEDRRAAYGKFREIRTGGDKKAVAVLTDDQKEKLEEMKGDKFEMPSRTR